MLETFVIALATLAIVLYAQARASARSIRRNRSRSEHKPLFLYPSDG